MSGKWFNSEFLKEIIADKITFRRISLMSLDLVLLITILIFCVGLLILIFLLLCLVCLNFLLFINSYFILYWITVFILCCFPFLHFFSLPSLCLVCILRLWLPWFNKWKVMSSFRCNCRRSVCKWRSHRLTFKIHTRWIIKKLFCLLLKRIA